MLENVTAHHLKTTHQKMLIFEYVNLEVYRVGWPKVEWAGPTHMGHTPTLQMGILQYKIGDRFDFCPSLYIVIQSQFSWDRVYLAAV